MYLLFPIWGHSLPQDLMMLIFGKLVNGFVFRNKVSSHEADSNLDKEKINEIISHEESECMFHFLER